ncbi:hypothetical protein EJB05_25585 [Eragrostis curvula]|uniref:Uncharacterized protein n=1 Tax=Eragrostis curvula TaxID=38414 RepID=A0A5J9UHT2_9POAL|nr:hypothetical protein EJB05_25585 [Eragrostis curvula]
MARLVARSTISRDPGIQGDRVFRLVRFLSCHASSAAAAIYYAVQGYMMIIGDQRIHGPGV